MRYTLPGERRRPTLPRLRSVVAVALLLGFPAVAAWVWCLPVLAVHGLAAASGTRASVGAWSFNPLSGALRMEHVRIANPEGFGEDDALHVRMLETRIAPGSLFSHTARIDSLTLDVAACAVVADARDQLNWAQFSATLRANTAKRNVSAWLAPLALVRARELHIERLDLGLERVRVVDRGTRPASTTNLTPRLRESFGPLTSARAAWEAAGEAALAETARAALESEDRAATRVLAAMVRSLGVRPRLSSTAVDALLQRLWPETPPEAERHP